MPGLLEVLNKRKQKGVSESRLQIKLCQEIFLAKAEESNAADFFSLKGGVVLFELTEGRRGFTKDLDLDFIFYSIKEEKIRAFFDVINHSTVESNIRLIVQEPMTDLNHENYRGKNVVVDFVDEFGTTFSLSFDIGVRTLPTLPIKKGTFSLGMNSQTQHVEINVDPPSQMIMEKLVSFLTWGIASTRVKDLLDIYWLLVHVPCPKEDLRFFAQNIILPRTSYKSLDEAFQKLERVLKSPILQKNLAQIDFWVKVEIPELIEYLLENLKWVLVS